MSNAWNRREEITREEEIGDKIREAIRRMHTGVMGEPDANTPTGRPRRYGYCIMKMKLK